MKHGNFISGALVGVTVVEVMVMVTGLATRPLLIWSTYQSTPKEALEDELDRKEVKVYWYLFWSS